MELRLVVENVLKYGLLVEVPSLREYRSWPTTWPCLTACLMLPLMCLLAYLIEVASYYKFIGHGIVR